MSRFPNNTNWKEEDQTSTDQKLPCKCYRRTSGVPVGGKALKSNRSEVKLLEVIEVLKAVSGIVGDWELSVVL